MKFDTSYYENPRQCPYRREYVHHDGEDDDFVHICTHNQRVKQALCASDGDEFPVDCPMDECTTQTQKLCYSCRHWKRQYIDTVHDTGECRVTGITTDTRYSCRHWAIQDGKL